MRAQLEVVVIAPSERFCNLLTCGAVWNPLRQVDHLALSIARVPLCDDVIVEQHSEQYRDQTDADNQITPTSVSAVPSRRLDVVDQALGHLTLGKIEKCSHDTALHDIQNLIEQGLLKKDPGGGRSTSYSLTDV